MGMDWDPEGDAERSKENRGRWLLAAAIVLGLLGFIGKQVYRWQAEREREREMRALYDSEHSERGY